MGVRCPNLRDDGNGPLLTGWDEERCTHSRSYGTGTERMSKRGVRSSSVGHLQFRVESYLDGSTRWPSCPKGEFLLLSDPPSLPSVRGRTDRVLRDTILGCICLTQEDTKKRQVVPFTVKSITTIGAIIVSFSYCKNCYCWCTFREILKVY